MTQYNSQYSGGLPDRWQRNRLRAAAIVICAVAALTLAPMRYNHADQLDSFWLQARYSVRELIANRLQRPVPKDPDIAIVGVDQKCYDHWKEPTLLWGPHFARVVNRLRISGARVIVFDYTPSGDQSEYVLPKWQNDSWQLALHETANVIWAKEFRRDEDGKPFQIHPHETLLQACKGADEHDPDYFLGFAEFPHQKTVVTSVRPAIEHDVNSVSLAARAVERYFQKDGVFRRNSWLIPGGPIVPLRKSGTALPNYPNNMGYVATEKRSVNNVFLHRDMYDFEAEPDVPDPGLRGKIVFVGETQPFGNDLHAVPFLALHGIRYADGVEIQAAFTRALLRGDILREPEGAAAWAVCLLAPIISVVAFLRLRWLSAAFLTLALAAAWILISFVLFSTAAIAIPITVPLAGLAVTGVGMISFITLSEERERRQVLGLWGMYQDPRLVSYLLGNPEARGGEGEEKTVTVLFADLVEFTRTVEKLPPRDALQALNRYLALIEGVVLKHGGLIDKYLGDGLMAQWGAPSTPGGVFREDHARAAIAACLDIREAAERLAREMPEAVHFGLRVTLNTGPVVFGWVGASRLEFTIVGDTVNVTSRLHETAKELRVNFLISEATYRQIADSVEVGQCLEVAIRGRTEPVTVMEITGAKGQDKATPLSVPGSVETVSPVTG